MVVIGSQRLSDKETLFVNLGAVVEEAAAHLNTAGLLFDFAAGATPGFGRPQYLIAHSLDSAAERCALLRIHSVKKAKGSQLTNVQYSPLLLPLSASLTLGQ